MEPLTPFESAAPLTPFMTAPLVEPAGPGGLEPGRRLEDGCGDEEDC